MIFKKLALLPILLLGAAPLAQAGMNPHYAEQQYNAIQGEALDVQQFRSGSPLLGASVQQKNREDGDSFCRKFTVVAPGAAPAYACYSKLPLEADDARESYESATRPETKVVFSLDGAIMVGATRLERDLGGLLCVKTSAVVPNPVPTYSCYSLEVPIGSGVSVGN